jgi:hypothetical protein
MHIGPRFEQQLMAGDIAPAQVIVDARNSTTAGCGGRLRDPGGGRLQ